VTATGVFAQLAAGYIAVMGLLVVWSVVRGWLR
jgi:hypothetical protein